MEKKFFFFDVDNTLTIWPTGEIPEDTKYCLKKLKEAGHGVALATGRLQIDGAYFGEKAHISDIIADGGESITIDKKIIFMNGIDAEASRAYLKNLTAKDIRWAITYKNERARHTPFSDVRQSVAEWDTYQTIVDESLKLDSIDSFYKIYVYLEKGEAEAKGVTPLLDEYIQYGEYCWLFEPMVKSKGVKKLLDYYGASYESAVVFGDGINDLSLFEPEFFNIAMGNGRVELKAKADYVTAACDDGGILKACRKFGWIEE